MPAGTLPKLIPGALTVCVTSGKGGVGKTTTALALAANLAARGCDVVVVDADIAGPNVHLLCDVVDVTLTATAQPLEVHLPLSPSGFRVATPVSIPGSCTVSDLASLVQFAGPPEIVIVDLPPGWTGEHANVCALYPDLVITAVSPTATAVADHCTHVTKWVQAWAAQNRRLASSDKRRKWDNLADQPEFVAVETMARFTGTVEGSDNIVTVRRIDALPAEVMVAAVNPMVSLPATATYTELADTDELDTLAELVEQRFNDIEAAPAA